MYGKTPDDYRENVVRVYVQKPKYARTIHKFLESSNFRDGYCRRYGITRDAFSKGHMLRTFEATFVDMDLAFRVKYGLRMMTWWSVYDADFSINDRAFEHRDSEIYCDVYAECGVENLECDESRTDNANFLRMGWDIECAGKMKEDGESRFPIAVWDNYQYITYAKEVMNLLPPKDKVVLRPFLDRQVFQKTERDDAVEEEYGAELDALKEALEAREETMYGEEERETGGSAKKKTDGDEKFKISREDWNGKTKGWSSDDWTVWLSREIPLQLGEEALKKVLDMTGKTNLEELIPDPKDTDPVTVICIALKRNDDENSDESGFVFADAVAFVYEYEGAEKLEEIFGEKIDRAGNVWKFGNIEFKTYSSEARMIHEFLEYRRRKGPDIEETWNGLVFFDMPYLWSRMHHLQIYGSEEDKKYATDVNFGYEKGKNVKSLYFERSTSTVAGGDRMERIVSTDLVVHNDGYLIITNSSFGEKNVSNTLDVISMKKLIYPRSCTSAIVAEMAKNGDLIEKSIDKLYEIKFKKSPDPAKDTLESKAIEIFNDFPMRKMQFKVSEGTKRWLKGGNALREYAEYCFVDSVLPVFIGGKLPLQVAVARETNLPLNEIFYTGVQKKVFSVLYQITKTNPEFAGKFLVPDKGTLWLHWPGVFDDFEKGFERAASEDPRLKSPFHRQSAVVVAPDSPSVVKKSQFDDLDDYGFEKAAGIARTTKTSAKKTTLKKIKGKDAKNSAFVSKSQTTMFSFFPGGRATATIGGADASKRKAPDTPTPPNPRPTKRQKTAKPKMGTSQKKYEGALVLEPIVRGFITEKVTVKKPQIPLGKAIENALSSGANREKIEEDVASALLSGRTTRRSTVAVEEEEIEVPSLVSTGDYEGLYPSILEANSLCYMTFLTTKTIEKYGYERWQYTERVLGTEDRISCGELLVDEKIAKEKGYRTDRLKVSYVYSEPDPKKTIYGTMVGMLKSLRRAAKRKKADADEVVKAIDVAIAESKEGKPYLDALSEKLKKVCDGRFEKMLSQPLPLIKRMAKQESSIYDSTQNALKIINNSTYGAPAVEESKAKLPMMEIGATVTAAGRTAITLAKTVALRTTAKTMKKYATENTGRCAKNRTIDCGILQRRLPYGWVRRNINRLASRFKNDVVTGDTDSIMVMLAALVYGMHEHRPGVPGGRDVIDDASKGSWFLIRQINGYQIGEMNLVFEKMAKVMLVNDKKFYKMLLCIFNNRPSSDILEKGGTIKRDTALFVQKIVAETNAFVFKAVGNGEPIKKVMARVVELVESKMDDLLHDKVHLRDLTSNKGLKKLNYKSMQEHVAVAEKMRNRGKQFSIGDTIRYSFVHVPFSDQELDAYRAYKTNCGLNCDSAKFPVRKRKGVELAEDVSEIEEKKLALDLQYIFEHKLVNPLVGHFRHMLFPLSREEYPHVDEYTMSPEEIENAQAVRKKTKARQTLSTRNLLFSKFESKLKARMTAAYENALDDRNRSRLSKNMSKWTTETLKRTFYECAFCKKIERTTDACEGSRESLVPKRACSDCLSSKVSLERSSSIEIEDLRAEYDVQKQVCTGCAYFLDNRFLNTDDCTSAHCAVYQKKEEILKKIAASERNLLFLKNPEENPRFAADAVGRKDHVSIAYEEKDDAADDARDDGDW
jgi:DNA polymerase elongation subunit (family B)